MFTNGRGQQRSTPYGHGARPLGVGSDGRPTRAPVPRPDMSAVPMALRAYVEYVEWQLAEAERKYGDCIMKEQAAWEDRTGHRMGL